jgi:nucleoside-diphosphate-sugar epimerase
MVEAITRAAGTSYTRPVNVGNPMEYTVLEIAELIKNLCGSKSSYEFRPLPENDPLRRRPDISKAKELYRWEPKVGIQQGLLKVIEWFRRKYD